MKVAVKIKNSKEVLIFDEDEYVDWYLSKGSSILHEVEKVKEDSNAS